ncbi:MAG: peroxidase [Planctomycetota bacterium]|nr:peroxidase [Planctomycetota bacterium]
MQDDELVSRIEKDWRAAGLEDRRMAILTYAEKLTLRPAEMCAEDVTALRAATLSDEDVLHLAQCVAYYAYANRIADGLGVQVEATFQP